MTYYIIDMSYDTDRPRFSQYAEEPAVAFITLPGIKVNTDIQFIQAARTGIKTGFLLYLGELLSFSLTELSKVIHVSLRTLQRYHPDHVLDADASAKVIQLSMLESRGMRVFGHQGAFNTWLKLPMPDLGGETPFDFMDTPFGFKVLDQILGRIEQGIFA